MMQYHAVFEMSEFLFQAKMLEGREMTKKLQDFTFFKLIEILPTIEMAEDFISKQEPITRMFFVLPFYTKMDEVRSKIEKQVEKQIEDQQEDSKES